VNQRELTAHHEAGHAVAVLMRGAGQLHYIDLNATDEYLGYTHYASKPCDSAFITYAGVWAEARAQWPLADLDAEDDDGCTFNDYVLGAFLANIDGDAEPYRTLMDADPLPVEFQRRREQCWDQELEREWTVIQTVAQLLLADSADMYHSAEHKTWHDAIEQLIN
jgi:hypothetical protein